MRSYAAMLSGHLEHAILLFLHLMPITWDSTEKKQAKITRRIHVNLVIIYRVDGWINEFYQQFSVISGR